MQRAGALARAPSRLLTCPPPLQVEFDPRPVRPLDQPEAVPNVLGIGSEEDTRENFSRLIPRQPPHDHAKLRRHDGHVLRFAGRLVEAHGARLLNSFDADRRWVCARGGGVSWLGSRAAARAAGACMQ